MYELTVIKLFHLQAEKQRLDADRMERQFLERERLRIEYERRREQERILREREELRRQQEQLRYEQERRPVKRPYDMDGRYSDVCVTLMHAVFICWIQLCSLVDPHGFCGSFLGKMTGLISVWPWMTVTAAQTSVAIRILITEKGDVTKTT